MLFPGKKETQVIFDNGVRRLILSVANGSWDTELVRVETTTAPFYEYIKVRCGRAHADQLVEATRRRAEMELRAAGQPDGELLQDEDGGAPGE